MAQAHLLREGFSQPQLSLQYDPQTFGSPEPYGTSFIHNPTMAQPMLQRQYRPEPESHTQLQHWPFQQGLPREFKPPVNASSNPSCNGLRYPQGQSWGGASGFDSSFAWNQSMQMEPYIMSDSDSQFRPNHDLVYDHMTTQNMVSKGRGEFDGQPSWAVSGLGGTPGGISINESDTVNSLSPQSYLSDGLDSSFSPSPMSNQASPGARWNIPNTSFPLAKVSSPRSALSEPHNGSIPTQSDESIMDFSGLPRMGLGIAMSSTPAVGPSHYGNELTSPMEEPQYTGSEYSYSQGRSPGASPWYPPGYSHNLSGLPVSPRGPQGHSAHIDGSSSASSEDDGRHSQYRSIPRSESRTDVAKRSRFQDRFQVPRSADAQAQRKFNDDILVQGKKDGLTYKEIRKKMVGEKPAESTLRGRFRSLTKARKDRVRRPVWTKLDVDLLNRIVEREFDRIDSNSPNPYALGLSQKLVKVPWKKVADFIDDNGGSYHFGNSTCKRKWLEVNSGPK